MKIGTGVCLAVFFLLLFRVYLNAQKNRYRLRTRAAEKFSEAFRDELQDLSQGSGNPTEFLEHTFQKHENAYLNFRPRLKGNSLKKFDEAWNEYSNGGPGSFLVAYWANGNAEIARQKRALAAGRIRRLLSFARS